MKRLLVCVVAFVLLVGCKTVSLGNEFKETITDNYDEDGNVTSTTRVTSQENRSWGGMFTDVKELKQDSVITVEGSWSMGQGAGVAEVSGAGQVEAFQAGLNMGQQMLGMLMPFLMQTSAPGAGDEGANWLDLVVERVLDRLEE